MKLISMIEFVLTKLKELRGDAPASGFGTSIEFTDRVEKYANFLKQPLTLGMFVPWDDGVVIEEPTEQDKKDHPQWAINYQQAKDRVLFKGFKLVEISKGLRIVKNEKLDCQVMANQFEDHYYICNEFANIESLTGYDLELTPSAIKQLGL